MTKPLTKADIPTTAIGLSEFYADLFNQSHRQVFADMACWYYLHHLARKDGYLP